MYIRNQGPKLYDIEYMVKEYRRILDSCELTVGSWNETLETEFAQLTGVRYGITCASGGDAFTMILLALKHRGVKRIFIPTNTHLATINPAMILGLEVEIVDVNGDMLIDLHNVVPELERNDILCIVTIGGWLPSDLQDQIEEIEKRGAIIVLDAAHAHGAVYNGKPVGSWGIAASFSFYASKLVCGGEGGIAVTDDREFARELMRIRDCGKVCQTYDEFVSIGISSRLSNIMAMLATVQFRHLKEIIEVRPKFAEMYKESIGNNARMIEPDYHDISNWYKYTIVLKDQQETTELEHYMLANGIELSSRTFPFPLHKQPVVRKYLGFTPECPMADSLSVTHLCLPGYIGITEEEVAFVCSKLKNFWHR